MSRSEQNEVSEYRKLCKIFHYSISRDAFRWFSVLQPGSLTSWDDIERAFLYKLFDDAETTRENVNKDNWDKFLATLDEEYMIPIQLLDDIMAKRDEQHGFGDQAGQPKLRLVIRPQHRTIQRMRHRSTPTHQC